MDWLHWIGNQHYSINSFIKEAKRIGVSRRVQPKILKKMSWGDKIYLASRENGKKSPVVFGYFIVENLIGIKLEEMPEDLQGKVDNVDPGLGMFEERGCGFLVIGAFYTTTASVEQLADYAEDPQIRGKGLKIFPKPWPLMKTLPSFRGFRAFDAKQFLEDVIAQPGDKRRLAGCYYP